MLIFRTTWNSSFFSQVMWSCVLEWRPRLPSPSSLLQLSFTTSLHRCGKKELASILCICFYNLSLNLFPCFPGSLLSWPTFPASRLETERFARTITAKSYVFQIIFSTLQPSLNKSCFCLLCSVLQHGSVFCYKMDDVESQLGTNFASKRRQFFHFIYFPVELQVSYEVFLPRSPPSSFRPFVELCLTSPFISRFTCP